MNSSISMGRKSTRDNACKPLIRCGAGRRPVAKAHSLVAKAHGHPVGKSGSPGATRAGLLRDASRKSAHILSDGTLGLASVSVIVRLASNSSRRALRSSVTVISCQRDRVGSFGGCFRRSTARPQSSVRHPHWIRFVRLFPAARRAVGPFWAPSQSSRGLAGAMPRRGYNRTGIKWRRTRSGRTAPARQPGTSTPSGPRRSSPGCRR